MPAKDRPFTKLGALVCFGQKGVDRLEEGLCPRCGSGDKAFRTAIAIEEHEIGGLCQLCQDFIFTPSSSTMEH